MSHNIIYRIKRLYLIFIRLFQSQYALMVAYRAEITLWALSGILPLIMLGLWVSSDQLPDNYFDKVSICRYFISVFIVRQFTAVWVMISFEEDQLEGKLSPFLLQPITPFWRYLFSHLAEQFSRLPIVILMLIILFVFLPNAFWFPSLKSLILFVFFVFWAFILRFLLHWTFAMLCFWNERASSLERLLLLPYIFLSGLVAPIESFPSHVKNIALITPFPYMISFPSKLLAQETVDLFNSVLLMSIWSVVLVILSIFTWKKGVKKYSAMGG